MQSMLKDSGRSPVPMSPPPWMAWLTRFVLDACRDRYVVKCGAAPAVPPRGLPPCASGVNPRTPGSAPVGEVAHTRVPISRRAVPRPLPHRAGLTVLASLPGGCADPPVRWPLLTTRESPEPNLMPRTTLLLRAVALVLLLIGGASAAHAQDRAGAPPGTTISQ